MGLLKTFDPAALIVSFRGYILRGFAEDSLVKIARTEESFRLKVGTTGETARARNRNRSGTVECSILQSSADNDFLSGVIILDELLGTGTGVLLVRDLLGTTLVNGDGAYLEKPADAEFAKEIQARNWKLVVPDMDMFIGGSFPTV